MPVDEDEEAQEEIPGVVRTDLRCVAVAYFIARGEDQREFEFCQHGTAQRTITKGECTSLPRHMLKYSSSCMGRRNLIRLKRHVGNLPKQ